MPPILNALPYSAEQGKVVAKGVHETVNPYQIVVWVSVTPVEQFELPQDAPRFPAILDTGHNGNFAIGPKHLRTWTGLNWDAFPEDEIRTFRGVRLPTRRAYVWIHPNVEESDQVDSDRSPFRVELDDGIAVYGDNEQVGKDANTVVLAGPRLPLLGLRALTGMCCQFHIDGERRLVSLSAPD